MPVCTTEGCAEVTDLICLTNTGYNEYPHWSPDGEKILYTTADDIHAKADIYIMNVDGTDKVNLTNTPEVNEVEPKWSPDGKSIAFGREGDVWVIDADGTNQVNLTPGPEDGRWSAWSPDGEKIVFSTTRTAGDIPAGCEGGCQTPQEL